ncbi:MAG: amidohydrolase family protein [Myxococcota bacterium]
MTKRDRLISADSHINEPPDLWTSRVRAKFKDRAPRIERLAQGDAWIMEGSATPINFGNNANGGTPPETRSPWVRWEEIRRGGWVPAVRLEEQAEDGVEAEVLYPTPRVSHNVLANNRDREFHLDCIRAYNDWLSEYASHAPERLIGIAVMPTTGVGDAIAELERAMALPGLRGVLLGRYPNGDLVTKPEDDAFWARAAERGVPLHVHVGLAAVMSDEDPDRKKPGARGELRNLDASVRTYEVITSGMFDRFPRLDFVFAEVDCGWIPYAKEQFDNRFHRRAASDRPPIAHPPSHYFDHNIATTYVTDTFGIQNRHSIGVERMMWSSDFPHSGTDWPNSRRQIEADFEGVDARERRAILAGNAARIYGLD